MEGKKYIYILIFFLGLYIFTQINFKPVTQKDSTEKNESSEEKPAVSGYGSTPDGQTYISGIITDAATSTVLPGADFMVGGRSGTGNPPLCNPSAPCKTGSGGNYYVAVDPGSYTLTVSQSTYQNHTYDFAVQYGDKLSYSTGMCPLVRIAGKTPYHSTIQSAYNAAIHGDTIEVLSSDPFTEDLLFDEGKLVTVKGGYNCDYTPSATFSVVKGILSSSVISHGTSTMSFIEFQQ
jgi:hypothetical protein